MNEQTPRDPQQPIDANDPTPQHPVAQPADPQANTTQQPIPNPAAGATPKRGRGILKPVLIGTGAAVAVLAVVGVGLGIAEAMNDNDDPSRHDQSAPAATVPVQSPTSTAGSGDGSGQGGTDTSSPAPSAPTTSQDTAAAFASAIDTAVAAAGGEGATSVEWDGSGWKVDVRMTGGSEVEVLVPTSGTPVVRQDTDDSLSDTLLDTSRLADILDAAIAAAGGGSVDKIETESDDGHYYQVQVVRADGEDVDIDLAQDLSVMSSDDD